MKIAFFQSVHSLISFQIFLKKYYFLLSYFFAGTMLGCKKAFFLNQKY